jgi:hypothetical protein
LIGWLVSILTTSRQNESTFVFAIIYIYYMYIINNVAYTIDVNSALFISWFESFQLTGASDNNQFETRPSVYDKSEIGEITVLVCRTNY